MTKPKAKSKAKSESKDTKKTKDTAVEADQSQDTPPTPEPQLTPPPITDTGLESQVEAYLHKYMEPIDEMICDLWFSLSTTRDEMAVLRSDIYDLTNTIESVRLTVPVMKAGVMARRKKRGKISIRDKETGTVYPSKNNTYQTMLKAGELDTLVKEGVFGANPAANSFGWFALHRAWPERFEEVEG